MVGRPTMGMEESLSLLSVVTDSLEGVAEKMRGMSDGELERLRSQLRGMLGTSEGREEFTSLQRALASRNDRLESEGLSRAHRLQLDILVAVKTGIQAFLHPDINITPRALIEIFLQVRCRNVACQSQLPADDCSCQVCSAKGGFCNLCMCTVCNKFDFDANTCRWIGCDFCLHWCHTDCAIRKGHISMGRCAKRPHDSEEMQFRCSACGHTSELFGFVKDVFNTCGETWDGGVLARELDCVRRIFHGSSDPKGRALYAHSQVAIHDLEGGANHRDIVRSVLVFFTDTEERVKGQASGVGRVGLDPVATTVSPSAKDMRSANGAVGGSGSLVSPLDAVARISSLVHDAIHKTDIVHADDRTTSLKRARQALEMYDREVEDKRRESEEIAYERRSKRQQLADMERHMREKLQEAEHLQSQAMQRRQEAAQLQRVIDAKSEKIEHEYNSRFMKLQLEEAEARRCRLKEVVGALERAKTAGSSTDRNLTIFAEIQRLLKHIEFPPHPGNISIPSHSTSNAHDHSPGPSHAGGGGGGE